MAAALFVSPRMFDLATVDSGDWRAALPVTNLQDMQPSRLARTTNLSNTFFVVEFTSAVIVNAIFLINTNLTASATIRVRTAASEANLTAAPTFDSTAVSAWPGTGRPTDEGLTRFNVFKSLANSTARVWLRVDLADGTNPDTYIDIGRCLAGQAVQPAINFAYDWSWSHAPADVVVPTAFGHTLTQARLRPRIFNLPFEALTEAEMWASIGDLQRLRGLAQDVAVCLDSAATTYLHRYCLHGLLGDPIDFSQPFVDAYAGRVSLRELL